VTSRIKQYLRIVVALLFAYTAGFQAWVFWQLLRHQEVTLCEYSVAVNRLEFALALAVFLLALAVFGLSILSKGGDT